VAADATASTSGHSTAAAEPAEHSLIARPFLPFCTMYRSKLEKTLNKTLLKSPINKPSVNIDSPHLWSTSTGHGGRFSNIDRSVRARIAEVPRTPADGLLADVARSARLRVAPTQPRSCRAMAGRRARLQAVRGELRGGRAADASRAGVRAYILPRVSGRLGGEERHCHRGGRRWRQWGFVPDVPHRMQRRGGGPAHKLWCSRRCGDLCRCHARTHSQRERERERERESARARASERESERARETHTRCSGTDSTS
jgi:hypothetical protein